MLTTTQAAEKLGISARTLQRWSEKGWVPFTDTPYGRIYDPAKIQQVKERARNGDRN